VLASLSRGTPAATSRLQPGKANRTAVIADQNDEEFFAPLSSDERKALVTVLKRLVEAHGLRKLPID